MSRSSLREALEAIRLHDQKRMYQSCPDCWTDRCRNNGGICESKRYSKTGEIALKALLEDEQENSDE